MDVNTTNIINQLVSDLNLDSSDAKPLGQIWLVQRLKSLTNWSMDKPSALDIAEAGFYCPHSDQRSNDIVKCFSCFIELDGWEPTDNPWDEHRKRALSTSPPCKFVEIGKEESALTLDDFLEIFKSVMLRITENKYKTSLEAALALHKKKKAALKKDLQKLGMS